MTAWMERVKTGIKHMGDWFGAANVDVATGPPAEQLDGRPTMRPAVDIYENASELLLVADVPGACPDTTHVRVDGGQMTLWARTAMSPNSQPLLGDARDADWYASFMLPEGTDAEQTRASVRNGVLTIRLPKRARPAPRRIPVSGG